MTVTFLQMHGIGPPDKMNNLIKNWITAQYIDVNSNEYDDVCWAVDELFNLAHDNPGQLLTIIEDILKMDTSPKVLGALGAGVLEDMLVYHGDSYIDKLIACAANCAAFKTALQFTFLDQNEVSKDVFNKLQQIKNPTL
jgi:hypothetical protein